MEIKMNRLWYIKTIINFVSNETEIVVLSAHIQ